MCACGTFCRELVADVGEAVGGADGFRNADAVAVDGGVAAIAEPHGAAPGLGEEVEKLLVVVAAQEHGVEPRHRPPGEDVEDLAAVQSAVNVVAEVDDDGAGATGGRAGIFGNQRMQPLEQADAAVDVADDVDPDPVGDAGRLQPDAVPLAEQAAESAPGPAGRAALHELPGPFQAARQWIRHIAIILFRTRTTHRSRVHPQLLSYIYRLRSKSRKSPPPAARTSISRRSAPYTAYLNRALVVTQSFLHAGHAAAAQ